MGERDKGKGERGRGKGERGRGKGEREFLDFSKMFLSSSFSGLTLGTFFGCSGLISSIPLSPFPFPLSP
jgi:hypothetical protein